MEHEKPEAIRPREMVLLHLRNHPRAKEKYEVSASLTYAGISFATGIERHKLLAVLRRMTNKKKIAKKTSTVIGFIGTKEIFYLTPSGLKEATTLRDKYRVMKIKIIQPDGSEISTTVGEVNGILGTRFRTVDILRELRADGRFNPPTQKEIESMVKKPGLMGSQIGSLTRTEIRGTHLDLPLPEKESVERYKAILVHFWQKGQVEADEMTQLERLCETFGMSFGVCETFIKRSNREDKQNAVPFSIYRGMYRATVDGRSITREESVVLEALRISLGLTKYEKKAIENDVNEEVEK